MTSFALSEGSVLLQHDGNVRVYQPDSLQDALNDAVDGDTLFLSKGKFDGDIKIEKKVTLRGVGKETIVNGDITIAIPDSVTLESTLLESLNLGYVAIYEGMLVGDVKVTKPVNGLTIKKCLLWKVNLSATMHDVVIDRCSITSEFIISSEKVKSMNVVNSKVQQLKPTQNIVTSREISFINCNINSFYYYWDDYTDYYRGSFINCIIGGGSNQQYFYQTTFINCLLTPYIISINRNVKSDCYEEENQEILKTNYSSYLDDYLDCKYSTEELMAKGYLGNDGTVVGCNGGATPWCLVPSVPAVVESNLLLDVENKKLNVTLKLLAK